MTRALVVIGCGGLAYHCIPNVLAAVGPVEQIVLADGDTVEEHNAVRQWQAVGENKADCAGGLVESLLSDTSLDTVGVESVEAMVTAANIEDCFRWVGQAEEIVVLVLPDNHTCRVFVHTWLTAYARRMGDRVVIHEIVAGNDPEAGWCYTSMMNGETLAGDWMYWHPDIQEGADAEARGDAPQQVVSCAAELQSRFSNSQTGVLIGEAVGRCLAQDGQYMFYWRKEKREGRPDSVQVRTWAERYLLKPEQTERTV